MNRMLEDKQKYSYPIELYFTDEQVFFDICLFLFFTLCASWKLPKTPWMQGIIWGFFLFLLIITVLKFHYPAMTITEDGVSYFEPFHKNCQKFLPWKNVVCISFTDYNGQAYFRYRYGFTFYTKRKFTLFNRKFRRSDKLNCYSFRKMIYLGQIIREIEINQMVQETFEIKTGRKNREPKGSLLAEVFMIGVLIAVAYNVLPALFYFIIDITKHFIMDIIK